MERGRARGLLGAPAPIRYAAAVAVTVVAYLLKQRFAGYLEPTFILFYPAVMVAAVFGGLGPGLAATTLSMLLAALRVMPSQHGSRPLDARDAVALAAFTIVGAFMSVVAAVARRRARQLARYERERELLQRLGAERERLAESEGLYRTLFQLNPSGVILLDEGGAIVAFNDKACRQLGYDREQFAHLHIHDIDPDEPEPGLVRAHLAQIAERGTDEFEAVQRTRTGELRTALVSVRPVQVAGRRHFLAVWQDVTERRSLEQQLRQAQKLESVGRLAGGVAHDFNNLLTVILGCTEALKRLRGLQPDAIENIQEIAAASGRARDLTRQLLAFARKQVIAPVPLDLGEEVRSLEKMLGRLLGEDVELQVALEPGLWTVNADPSQIEQVLLNLAVNARDAMPGGGRLGIAARNRTVTGPDGPSGEGIQPGDWVQLVVTDTGGGMTPEARGHLFEPFFTTKAPGKGTGLGLATVYGIVTQAGGHIRVATEAGRGTTFEISFPRVLRSPAPSPSPRTPATAAGTEHVLVVEDDPQVRGVIVRTLASEGYRVQAAAHPREALDLDPERLEPVQLLVTDVVMPGMDGHALATQLTSRHPRLRVLYLSGYSGDVISQRGVLDSGIEFLAKPFTRSTLLDKVRAVLDAGQERPSATRPPPSPSGSATPSPG